MKNYLISFCLFAIPANGLSLMVYKAARKKSKLWVIEYFFIYTPWLALLGLSVFFLKSMSSLEENSSMQLFVMILQSVAAGVLGGLVLAPRLMFFSESRFSNIRTTFFSALVMSGLYLITRFLLFTVMGNTLITLDPGGP